jgi:hypothetical protein
MNRWSYPSLGSLRNLQSRDPADAAPRLVPFGPLGAGQWTGHAAGLLVVVGILLIVLIGIPESRAFFLTSLLFGIALGLLFWVRHNSKKTL